MSTYLQSTSDAPPLRIGLLLNGTKLPACFAEVVDHIIRSDFARLELVVVNADRPRQRPLLKRVCDTFRDHRRRNALLFTLYTMWDRRNVPASLDPFAPVDCSERFKDISSLHVAPITTKFVHRFPPEAVERVREKQLDVLIRFGFNILRGEILTAAKYGVWSYHHGDNDYYRGGPSYFWELYEGNPISGVILQVLTEQLDAGKVLYKGLFATRHSPSHGLNRIQPYWGASTFVIQKLRELHQYGWDHLERTAVPPAPYLGRKKIYSTPSNGEVLRWVAPALAQTAARRLKERWATQHWRLAIRNGSRSVLDSSDPPDLTGFRWIESPRGHFYADPFVTVVDGKHWLFFEDFDYATKRGRIACAEIRGTGIGDPVPVLETPYHLSYPCVFWDNNELWMIPESAANRTVELYRCASFPQKWEKVGNLFEGRAVDTTVWVQEGTYWFFTTLRDVRGLGGQLWLFGADSLTGKWNAHPANPLSTDIRVNRGAGAVFRHNGKLYRPSQDGSRNYGYSVTLNEILVLDRSRYQEKAAVSILPTWAEGLTATHTYSRAGDAEVIDGRAKVPASKTSTA